MFMRSPMRAAVFVALAAAAVVGFASVVVDSGTASSDVPLIVPLAASPTAPTTPSAPAEPAPAARAPAAAHGPELVSPAWVASTAAAAGIPGPALRAYADAQLHLASEDPGCHLGWTTLAGIGWVESQHGTYGGRTLGEDGLSSSPILGPTLDGSGDLAAIGADGSGTSEWAQAAGPMQFIPSTWSRWTADGDGDGVANVQDLDDAAYAAGRYLCASGSLADGSGWARAVLSYNHSQAYVDQVYAAAQTYASRTS
ncbi:hypothetical protein JCM18899A_45580 [Nocardioides sp. AN3]